MTGMYFIPWSSSVDVLRQTLNKKGRLIEPPPQVRGLVGRTLGDGQALTDRSCSLTYITFPTAHEEVLRYAAFISP